MMDKEDRDWFKKYTDSRFQLQYVIGILALGMSFLAIILMLLHESGILLKH